MHIRRIGIGIAALLTLGAAELAHAQGAFENPKPGVPPVIIEEPFFDVSVVEPDVPVPRNGAILILSSELEPPIVSVSSIEGGATMIFGGTITLVSSNYWAWTPTEPLALGLYDVRAASPFGGSARAEITVVDEIVLEPPAVTSDPIASWVARPHGVAVCSLWTGAELVPGVPFAVTVIGTALVSTQLATDAPPELTHQFLFRTVRPEADDLPFVPIHEQVTAGPYEEQADEYCYTVEAIDLVTRTVHRYDQEFACASHGDLPGFDERPADVPDEALLRHNCISPPEGLDERWCLINNQCLEFTDPVTLAATFCQTYRDFCPDSVPMQAGASGMSPSADSGGTSAGGSGGVTAGQGGAAAIAGGSDESEQPEEPEAEKPMHTGGCSVQVTDDSTSFAMLVLAVGLLARRRLNAKRETR